MTTSFSQLDGILFAADMEEASELFQRHPDAILLEESVDYPGNLTAVPLDNEEEFVREHSQFVSPRCLLNDLFMLPAFLAEMREEGREVVASPEARELISRVDSWAQPYRPEGFRTELFPYQQFSLVRALERAVNQKQQKDGFFFNWGTGCIQGDAEININRGGNGTRIKLRDLVKRFNGEPDRYSWDLSIPTYVQREVDGVLRLGRLKHAWFSGVKTTYTLTTDSGRTIRATEEHPFLSERGWVKLGDLKVGDRVRVRGAQAAGRPRKAKAHYRQVKALPAHPYSGFQDRVPYHRLVAEATMNGLSYEEFLFYVRAERVIGLDFLDPEVWAVHHKDGDHRNNSPENLEVLTHKEHWSGHGHSGSMNHVLYKTTTEVITSIEKYGEEDTFDLEVEDDPHNFLANGFVVHNSGKSIAASAGVQELLVNMEEVDLVLVFTLRKMKINLSRFIEQFSEAKTEVIDGTKARRRKRYAESSNRVWILNYEKARVDFVELEKAVKGKRVLFIFDEVSKILRGENARNKSRMGMDKLLRRTEKSIVWPMSASVVSHSPFRYHDVFDLMNTDNPLGSRKEFAERYCSSIGTYMLRGRIPIIEYNWSKDALSEVRHRVSDRVQTLRKTDPGVRESFKTMTTEVIDVQPSSEEEKLFDAILDDAEEQQELLGEEFTVAEHYAALRFVSNTPAALLASESGVCQRIVEKVGRDKILKIASTKFEMVADLIEEIGQQGDQAVVFTHWTNMSLFPLAEVLSERRLKHVLHYGTGMTDKEAQQAQDAFKADSSITAFLSSDAGAMGLNFQNARYVIMVESPYDYDIFMQRRDRIDRADSYLEGLTCYVMVSENKVEQRIWQVMNHRRLISSTVQGTVEDLSRLSPEEEAESKLSESAFARALFR